MGKKPKPSRDELKAMLVQLLFLPDKELKSLIAEVENEIDEREIAWIKKNVIKEPFSKRPTAKQIISAGMKKRGLTRAKK